GRAGPARAVGTSGSAGTTPPCRRRRTARCPHVRAAGSRRWRCRLRGWPRRCTGSSCPSLLHYVEQCCCVVEQVLVLRTLLRDEAPTDLDVREPAPQYDESQAPEPATDEGRHLEGHDQRACRSPPAEGNPDE